MIAPLSAWAGLYIPSQDTQLNARIEQMLLLAGAPALSKPYNLDLVEHYLEKSRYRHPRVYASIESQLERYRDRVGISVAKVSAAYTDVSYDNELLDRLEANQYGEQLSSQYNGHVAGYAKLGDWMSVSAGASYYEVNSEGNDVYVPSNSYVSFHAMNTQLDIGYRDSWMSPSFDSALLLSTNASPSLGVTLSNILPYESLWNLRYELSFRQLSEYSRILYGDKVETGKPALVTTHLSVEPIDGWTLALNRTMQFGGGSREITAKSILQAFFNPVAYDNNGEEGIEGCEATIQNTCEFGNQLASISTRMDFKGSTPFSIYGEYAGEDTATDKNTRLGNLAITGGLIFPSLPGFGRAASSTLGIELSSWQNGWYTHQIYLDGYVNNGAGMGHWFNNNRTTARGVSGKSATIRTQFFQGLDTQYTATFRYISNDSEWSSYSYTDGYELDFGASLPWNSHYLEARLYMGKDVFDQSFVKAQIGISL
jgi:hypothetical protein